EVKRCCGDDSLGVALRKNSSMPGLYMKNKSLFCNGRGFCFSIAFFHWAYFLMIKSSDRQMLKLS
ncbi:hypothetical protein, partial [Nodularia spumigena]|uniref:hypothetical protein n=1 Tax=Nodularia spumigena TaxID=70799 RepID=UPI0030DA45F9